jgi:hypothetical protein
MKKIFILSILTFCFSVISYSQEKKNRVQFEAGEILASKEKMMFDDDYTQSLEPYQNSIIGVATGNKNPMKKSDLIVRGGITMVKITNENGEIKKGDFITTSSTKGAGMKALKSGMMIGVALEDSKDGLVKAKVLIQYIKQ